MSVATPVQPPTQSGPAWAIARLFPNQGQWSEGDYLFITRASRSMAELSDGRIEVLPMPATSHQRIVRFVVELLMMFVAPPRLGEVLFAPLRVRLRDGKFREPDIVFMLSAHRDRINDQYWEGADLVVEVVNEDDRERDLVTKRREYAEAGISEYWIIDPKEHTVTVLSLAHESYSVHSEASGDGMVHSKLLAGFGADVNKVFEAAAGT